MNIHYDVHLATTSEFVMRADLNVIGKMHHLKIDALRRIARAGDDELTYLHMTLQDDIVVSRVVDDFVPNNMFDYNR